ncbi:MAG: LamG-like jellyroll fold domain-containing protein [Cytophagales bacterium]|nr:LamG-like jellyroll fold domain-containing protein [Cytophagales bacterium]
MKTHLQKYIGGIALLLCNVATTLAQLQPPGDRGIYFDGDDYLKAPAISPSIVTIQAWIKPYSFGTNRGIVSTLAAAGSGMNGYALEVEPDGKVTFSIGEVGNRDQVTSSTILQPNTWYHVAGVYDGITLSLYIDGNPEGFVFSTRISNPRYVSIGGLFDNANFFHGQIDEVRIFGTARTATQIVTDMSSSSLVGGEINFWRFEEGTGSTSIDWNLSVNNIVFGPSPHTPLWALRVTNTLASGPGSFRQAINSANILPLRQYIDFSIPTSDPNYSGGVWTVQPFLGIPSPVNDSTFIDGYSAFGSAPATSSTPATIAIQISQPTSGNTLELTGNDPVIVRGLSIAQSVSSGLAALWIEGSNHIVQGNHIGVDAAGNAPFPSSSSGGVVIQSSGPAITNNTIGGLLPEHRNVISGNLSNGIRIDGVGAGTSNNNKILGNYIGVAADGITPLPNSGNGIRIGQHSNNNQIGNGTAAGENIIAHNSSWGVEVSGIFAAGNILSRNRIFGNLAGGIHLLLGGNNSKSAPNITFISSSVIGGTCQAGDIIEVYIDSPQTGTTDQGRIFVGQTVATGTTWSLAGTFTSGTRYTATATDNINGTSPFCFGVSTSAQTAQSGLWSSPSTWVAGMVPFPGADVTISPNHNIIADQNILVSDCAISSNASLQMGSYNFSADDVFLGGKLELTGAVNTFNSLYDMGGSGTLIVNSAATATLLGSMPGSFFNVASNRIIFAGTTSYNIPTRNYPTIEIQGSGDRILSPGIPTTISGHLIHNGTGDFQAPSTQVIMSSSGLIPHEIQANGGEIYLSNLIILGNTTSAGVKTVYVSGLLDVNTSVTFTNDGTLNINSATGAIIGMGTFQNKGELIYQSNSNITVANFIANTPNNVVIYDNGFAQVRPTTYYKLVVRNSRSTPANAVINAYQLIFSNDETSAFLTLGINSYLTITDDLIMNNPHGSTLDFGLGSAAVTVQGDLLGNSVSNIICTPSALNTHTLNLYGATNQVGTYIASIGNVHVRYLGTNQTVFPTYNYVNLEINGGGVKQLQGNTQVSSALTLVNGRLQLGNYSLTLTNSGLLSYTPSSWVETNGNGKLIYIGPSTNQIFPVGDAVAVRPVTVGTLGSGFNEVSFTNTITPPPSSNAAAGMWRINLPSSTSTHLIFSNVGGTANASSVIHSSNSPWVPLPTQPTRPPYATVNPVTFTGTAQNFTVMLPCTVPVITSVQNQSQFICSSTIGAAIIYLLPSSVTAGGFYDVDINNDNIWDYFNQPVTSNAIWLTNLPVGTTIINPKVRLSGTGCVSLSFPVSFTIAPSRPSIVSAQITPPTACQQPDGKLTLKIRHGVVAGLYHVDINNDNVNDFFNLPLSSDSLVVVQGMAENTAITSIKVTYAINNCASLPFAFNQTMPQVPRPASNLLVSGDTEADPGEIIQIRVHNVQSGVSYRLMRDTAQVGTPQTGTAGATLTFNTEPLQRNTTYRIIAKNITSGCEIALEQQVTIRVYHEVTDSLTLVALYNAAGGNNWQPSWNLQTPVRTWAGVRVRKGRVISLDLSSRRLSGRIAPVVQLPRLGRLNVSDNQLEFDAFEDVIPPLLARGVEVSLSPQAPINEELTITEFETKTVVLRTVAKGLRNRYQWFKDERRIEGAQSAELTLRNLRVTDAGVYTCEVTNPDAPGLVIKRRRIRLNVLEYMRSRSDSLILVALYRAMGGEAWHHRFDFSRPVATWFGIKVENGRVREINLSNNNLTGEIPDIFIPQPRGLGVLDSLIYLNLSHNRIRGNIPPSLANHRRLTYLDLSFNGLEGDLPAHLGDLSQLRTVWLSGNRFTSVPRQIGSLQQLENLFLDNNQLSHLPEEIGLLRHLRVLRLSGNKLSKIPETIVSIVSNLQSLSLSDNSLESLPETFNHLPNSLEQLFLHNNRLRTIPLSIANRPRLQLLTIYGNFLDFGTIEPLMLSLRANRSMAEVIYAPQAPVGTESELVVEEGQPFSLLVPMGGAANRYRWFKDDRPLPNDVHLAPWTVERAQADHTGRYYVQITNSHAPDLTLESLPIQVRITCAGGGTFPVQATGFTELCGNEPFAAALRAEISDAVEIRWLRNGSLLPEFRGATFTPQTAGKYRAMARRQGQNCFIFSNEIEIRRVEGISVSLNVAQGGRLSVSLSGNPSVQRYEWFLNGQLVASGNLQEFLAEQPGNYAVSIVTTGGCRFTSATVQVDNTIVGIDKWIPVESIHLYPNPSKEYITVRTSMLQIQDCQLFNALGQAVETNAAVMLPNKWELNISNLVAGMYLLRCRTRQGEVWLKWVKE